MQIENGSLVGATVWLNDKFVELTLALVKVKRRSKPVLRFISDDLTVVTKHFYSGGVTGAGISDHVLAYPEEVEEVIAKNIWEIEAYLEVEEEKKRKEREERRRRAEEKLKRIKQSPIAKPSSIPGLEFRRSDPEVVLNGEYIKLYLSIKAKETKRYLYLSDYITVDGKKLVKKFKQDMHLFWNNPPQKDPKEILQTLQREFEILNRNWV